MNIFAYNINGQILGIDTNTWNQNDLSGNTPFMISTATTLSGYNNVSSIVNWDKLSDMVDYRHSKIRKEIKDIYVAQTGTTWSGYTTDEQKVLSKYFIVDKDKRDEVLTQEEQDNYNHFKLYDFMSDDDY